MRRTVLSFLLLLAGLAIYACGNDTVAPTESGGPLSPNGSVAVTPDGSGGEAGTDDLALKKKTKVDVCHIPPGNPGNAHVINVSENALPAHLGHGDLVEPDFDEDPLTGVCSAAPPAPMCRCSQADLDAIIATVPGLTPPCYFDATVAYLNNGGSGGVEIDLAEIIVTPQACRSIDGDGNVSLIPISETEFPSVQSADRACRGPRPMQFRGRALSPVHSLGRSWRSADGEAVRQRILADRHPQTDIIDAIGYVFSGRFGRRSIRFSVHLSQVTGEGARVFGPRSVLPAERAQGGRAG